jgi:ectoine hydroxylase-related dioxygenase (phytanoyl-CoA dioxygenase family)
MQTAALSLPDNADNARRRYAEEGYCVLQNFFPADHLQQIYDDMMAVFARQLQRLGITQAAWRDPAGLRQNLIALFKADLGAYLGAARQSQMLPGIHHLITGPAVIGALKSLGLAAPTVSTKPVCHYMSEALKIPGGYHKAPPHQDWRSMQGSLDGVVLWIPLTDIDRDCYPLECVPGSHTYGLLNTVPHPATPMVEDARIGEADFVPLLPKRSDLMVLSGFLVHRTGARGDDRVRVAMSLRYNNAAEPNYVAHAYPTPYKYEYQLNLMFENFPAENEVAEIYAKLAR